MSDYEVSNYETDITLWSERQAILLRRAAAGELANGDEIDWQNVAEEIESVGRAERHTLESQIARAIEHLIKLLASPAAHSRANWLDSILHARAEAERLLEENPSLRPAVSGMIVKETRRTRPLVAKTLAVCGEVPLMGIESVTFTDEQVMGDWLPPEDVPWATVWTGR